MRRFRDLLCMGRCKCPGLLKSFLPVCIQLSGANPAFFIVHILIPGLPLEMAKVANGPLIHPPSSSALPGEKVDDGSQIAGFVSPGLGNLHLVEACLLAELQQKIFHFTAPPHGPKFSLIGRHFMTNVSFCPMVLGDSFQVRQKFFIDNVTSSVNFWINPIDGKQKILQILYLLT